MYSNFKNNIYPYVAVGRSLHTGPPPVLHCTPDAIYLISTQSNAAAVGMCRQMSRPTQQLIKI